MSIMIASLFFALLLDSQKLDAALRDAPKLPLLASITAGGREITLPLRGGTFERFSVFETSVLPPELAAQVPETRMYAGIGIDRRELRASIERTLDGWSAMIFFADGTSFVTPLPRDRTDPELTLEKVETVQRSRCAVKESAQKAGTGDARRRLPKTFGGTTRTYRLAVGATAEYTAFFHRDGDTEARTKRRAFDEITRGVARVNQVFSRDVGIQFVLVAKELDLIFTDADTDPYTSGVSLALLRENQDKLDAELTEAGYDIGHVVDIGGIGHGDLYSACTAGTRARGATGASQPTADTFWIDQVAHEIGHQFGARHSFNGTEGPCGGQDIRVQETAYEPGSGSTIMGYASLCGSQCIVYDADDYFHAISLGEMIAHATGAGACAVVASNGNRAPSVKFAGSRRLMIPKDTPFELKVKGNDPDRDPLRYSFEQYDTGDPSPEDNDFDGKRRPMFRSIIGTAPSRAFPSIANLARAVPATKSFESLPRTSNTLTFRVMARDTRGGFAFADKTVSVILTSGPFKITSPDAGTSWKSGETRTIVWDVARTQKPPLSCKNVKISLSTDGGTKFTELVARTRNDGSHNITVPAAGAVNSAVVRVDCLNRVFFDATPSFSIVP